MWSGEENLMNVVKIRSIAIARDIYFFNTTNTIIQNTAIL